MERKHTCASICDTLPTQSANHPWLVDDQNLEDDDNRDHIVYTLRDPLTQYRCQIPLFLGRRIRGCFHGWVVLSNHPYNDLWSLWNPVTSKTTLLPPLISKNGDQDLDSTQRCCLSSPPDVPGSVFMLLAVKKYAIAFCRLDCKRKRLKWVEMSYAKQMRSITGGYDSFLYSLTCCNGKVYALNNGNHKLLVIHIDIVVKGRETVISMLPYMKIPSLYINGCFEIASFLIGCCTELFYILLGFVEVEKETFRVVHVCKLDMNKMTWEQMDDLKDAAFFMDFAHGHSVCYSPTIAPELGGCVHVLGKSGNVVHSYDVKNKTIALSFMPSSLLECRLQGDHGETGEESTESRLLNIPFDVLKIIMEFCVGVEYLRFRASCKQCHLAAPMIQWSKGGRLKTYSLDWPWWMVFHNERRVITFTDPIHGDEYFIRTPQKLIGMSEIHCSMYGWLLIRRYMNGSMLFFKPFTNDIRELPIVPYLDTCYFSAPPTSSDCVVVGFSTYGEGDAFVHYVDGEPIWHRIRFNSPCDKSLPFCFATAYGQKNLYAMINGRQLNFIDINNEDYTWRQVLAEGPRSRCESSTQRFLTKRDQQLLLVLVGVSGDSVEVLKLNDCREWEEIESLGRHTIYICDRVCLCVEAKTPEMANKIYFPRLHYENGKIMFYSLESRRYHTTFNEKNIKRSFGDLMGTKHHFSPHVWIEPSWS